MATTTRSKRNPRKPSAPTCPHCQRELESACAVSKLAWGGALETYMVTCWGCRWRKQADYVVMQVQTVGLSHEYVASKIARAGLAAYVVTLAENVLTVGAFAQAA